MYYCSINGDGSLLLFFFSSSLFSGTRVYVAHPLYSVFRRFVTSTSLLYIMIMDIFTFLSYNTCALFFFLKQVQLMDLDLQVARIVLRLNILNLIVAQ
jgi:hypothetical protein